MREPLDLQPIKDRRAAATPGPWRTFPARPNSPNPNDCAFGPEAGRFTPDTLACIGECWAETVRGRQDRAQARANAEFIAAAPADVVALVAEVEAEREEAARMRALAADAWALIDDVLYRELREPMTLADALAGRARLTAAHVAHKKAAARYHTTPAAPGAAEPTDLSEVQHG